MSMAKQKCKAKRRDGTPCPNAASESGYCFTHDPARGAERAAARKRGGQRRRVPKVADTSTVQTPIRDMSGVLAILDVATLDTLAQENSAQRSRALVGVAMAYLKALEVGEMEERLETIEQALKLGKPKDESQNSN
jgi:hypothetical protein